MENIEEQKDSEEHSKGEDENPNQNNDPSGEEGKEQDEEVYDDVQEIKKMLSQDLGNGILIDPKKANRCCISCLIFIILGGASLLCFLSVFYINYCKNNENSFLCVMSVTCENIQKVCNQEAMSFELGSRKVLYRGCLMNGKFHGMGILYDQKAKFKIYEGNFKNGEYDGFGNLYNSQGKLIYSGMFLQGLYNGKGIEFEETTTKFPQNITSILDILGEINEEN